ncbi:MAG TPA: hypothetical protein VMB85_17765 [Bryobacteraceae bacterium]|jgi:hypothetical protein|nr:hypothetical protein [Bryobacteraceae bacterium]
MKNVMLIGLTLTMMAFAAAKSFHVTFDNNAWIGTSEVKAGNYKIQIEGDKAILKSGTTVIEIPAKLESATHKFPTNGVVMNTIHNKQEVEEIQIGGTNERIVFSGASPSGE